ncbi:MAG: RNA methyltransferase [Firmicutes bacterium]|nr:RNA methyltransferase [Bacillota bacterium]
MRYISSKENKIYKEAKKLLSHFGRAKSGLFLAEGKRITDDAIQSGAVNHIIISESYTGEIPDILTYRFPDKLFSDISDTKSSQGIVAVCSAQSKSASDISGNLLLICDGISDPGNLGTMIRTAECAYFDGVVLLKGCVDAYSPKTVRSTMGSIFRIPIYRIETYQLDMLADYDIAAAMLEDAKNLFDTAFQEKTAIIIGNEAHGLSAEVVSFANKRIKIPMRKGVSSLNAGVAAGIILYEVYRQIKMGDGCV